jgi:hypothetical protein
VRLSPHSAPISAASFPDASETAPGVFGYFINYSIVCIFEQSQDRAFRTFFGNECPNFCFVVLLCYRLTNGALRPAASQREQQSSPQFACKSSTELAMTRLAPLGSNSSQPSSSVSPSLEIPSGAAFSAALAAAKDKASSPSPYSYFDLVPPKPTFVGSGSTILGPTFVWPGGTVSPNRLEGPEEPGPGDNGPSLPLGPTVVGPGPTTLAPTFLWPLA